MYGLLGCETVFRNDLVLRGTVTSVHVCLRELATHHHRLPTVRHGVRFSLCKLRRHTKEWRYNPFIRDLGSYINWNVRLDAPFRLSQLGTLVGPKSGCLAEEKNFLPRSRIRRFIGRLVRWTFTAPTELLLLLAILQ